jgi:hypothetical protein
MVTYRIDFCFLLVLLLDSLDRKNIAGRRWNIVRFLLLVMYFSIYLLFYLLLYFYLLFNLKYTLKFAYTLVYTPYFKNLSCYFYVTATQSGYLL